MKLLIGGSPCTNWSIAQTKNRETEASGIGWELFLNYRIARGKFQPDFFLYENNKSMSPVIRAQITAELGVEPVLINSALVSAQNRQRLYWCGKRNVDGTYRQVNVPLPEDRGILLRDILESGVCWREKGYVLKANYGKASATNFFDGGHFPAPGAAEPVRVGTIESDVKNQNFDSRQYRVYSPDGKSVTLCGGGGGIGAKNGLYAVSVAGRVVGRRINEQGHRDDYNEAIPHFQYFEVNDNPGKTNCLTTVEKDNMIAEPVEAPAGMAWHGKTIPVYEVCDGKITIKGKTYPIRLHDGFYIIRKLSVRECMRLQTVPETYIFPVSDSRAYKMLGNGWTVDVIAHILSQFEGLRDEPVDVLSMYDGMGCGHIALDKLGVDIRRYHATEIDAYAIKTVQANFQNVLQLGDAFQVREESWQGDAYGD
uniref:DNA (cytosine-5-)-methyltransferase n=1 Tax=Caudovirales sp. ctu3532 TaxID=2827639 RepID=A0A8S5TI20_9CAUD|nr:MAG TPA: Cytosine specific methyltransferase [Caudovirales sp. ctu3532]